MKIFYLLLELACAIITCTISGVLYVKGEYNISGLLTLCGIVSLTMCIKSSGLLEDKKMPDTSNTSEAN